MRKVVALSVEDPFTNTVNGVVELAPERPENVYEPLEFVVVEVVAFAPILSVMVYPAPAVVDATVSVKTVPESENARA
jgi:hypothetical protein